MQFQGSLVYASNNFFKLTQAHKLTKWDNFNDGQFEWKNLSCRNTTKRIFIKQNNNNKIILNKTWYYCIVTS